MPVAWLKRCGRTVLFCGLACVAAAAGEAPRPAGAENLLLLSDFESDARDWRYVGGEEFPGARGAFERDARLAHGGQGSGKLSADFSGGGAYVGVWRDLSGLAARDVRELRLWVKASHVARLGVRLDDATGQCHQQNFEMRAKFPKGPGTWPAFWLLGVPRLTDKSVTSPEIDVVEQYGVNPNSLHTCLHQWHANGKHTASGGRFIVDGMADGFHTYGVRVTPEELTFYFDGVELRRAPTPAEAKVPLYLLVNLALGGGWPIDQTPDPSYLYVDYVRAYAK